MQASRIIANALAMAKAPGMLAYGGEQLNIVLDDLKRNRNLKINRVTQSITVSPGGYGPFALEADYLRTYDLFYPLPTSGGGTQSSMTQFLAPITMEQFDAEFKSPSISNYPYEFATDMSTDAQVWSGGSQGSGTLTSAGQMFIYPQTSGAIVMTHRYMKDQPDMVAPETSAQEPWFPFSDYLIDAIAARMMGITGDDRRPQFEQSAERKLRPYLIMEGDEQQAVIRVELDPRQFHFARNLKPTKAQPF